MTCTYYLTNSQKSKDSIHILYFDWETDVTKLINIGIVLGIELNYIRKTDRGHARPEV